MRNLPLLDIPYNLFRLEVFDFILIVSLPAPLFFFGAVAFQPLMILYPFVSFALLLWVKSLKKDKRYGYVQRLFYKFSAVLRERIRKEPARIFYP